MLLFLLNYINLIFFPFPAFHLPTVHDVPDGVVDAGDDRDARVRRRVEEVLREEFLQRILEQRQAEDPGLPPGGVPAPSDCKLDLVLLFDIR